MSDGWQLIRSAETNSQDDKPSLRWELSPELDIDTFNFNVAVLETDERLSQNHFHYHENQEELIYIAAGRCQVEVTHDQVVLEQDDVIRFDKGKAGAHLAHNPFDEPCRIVAIGWPPEGRYPVEQMKRHDELME